MRIDGFKHSNLKTGAPNEREAISPLRQRLLEDMNMCRFVPDTQTRVYLHYVLDLWFERVVKGRLRRSPTGALYR